MSPSGTFQAVRPPQRPRPDYRLGDGTKVPSVTQALAVVAKPALINWAYRMGVQGDDINAHRDFAADVGTLAHAMIEATLRGERATRDGYSDDHVELALCAWRNFRSWHEQHDVEPIALEAELVSETHRYGGTVDFYGRIDGRLEVIDFKTSSGIYDEHVAQVAAYSALLVENGLHVEAVRILQLSRDEPTYSERIETESEGYLEFFLHALALYRAQYDLRSRARRNHAREVKPPTQS